MPSHQRFPVVILPLDEASEELAAKLTDRIELAEPELLSTNWVCRRPRWSEDSSKETVDRFRKLLEPGALEGTNYSPASPVMKVVVLLLGNLSQKQADVHEALRSFRQHPDLTPPLQGQLLPLAVLDIAPFTIGDGALAPRDSLPRLTELLRTISWQPNVYLVHNISSDGLWVANRENLHVAISVFLEGLILGQHWKDFGNTWLNDFDHSYAGGPRYATVSPLCIETPQVELREYLTHVSYHEVLSRAQDNTGNGAATVSLPFPGQLSDEASVTEGAPTFGLQPNRPRVLEAIAQFQGRVENARIQFEGQFRAWHKAVPADLHRTRLDLARAARQQLEEHADALRNRVRSAMAQPYFLFELNAVQDALANDGSNSGPSDSAANFVWGEADVSGGVAPLYDKVQAVARKMPNFLNLAAHLILALGLFMWWILPLLEDAGPNAAKAWTALAVWLFLVAYLAWRIPAGKITSELQRVTERYSEKINAVKEKHSLIAQRLARHWTYKLQARAHDTNASMRYNLELAVGHLKATEEKERGDYPYPDVDIDKIMGNPSPTLRIMEKPADLAPVLETLHQDADSILNKLTLPTKRLVIELEDRNPAELERELRTAIREKYVSTGLVHEENLEARLGQMVGEPGFAPPALLPIPGALFPRSSQHYCACPEAWRDRLQAVLGQAKDNFTWVGLKTEDRVYFFRVYFAIDPENLFDHLGGLG